MRKHIKWILLLLLALYLAPDVLGIVPEFVRSGNLWQVVQGHFNIFSVTSFISFSFAGVAFFLLFYHYYQRDIGIVFIGKLLLTLISYMVVRYLLEEMLMPLLADGSNYGRGTTLSYYFADNLLYGMFYGGTGIVYYFMQRASKAEKEKQALLVEKQHAELSFLRSQINPHFLFNSLNNIYALVYHKNDQSLTAIQQLSGLLRYILYAKEDTVPVQKELEYIQNYIDLELMRHEKKELVHFDAKLSADQPEIVPLLLLPFVENAFKHGDLNQSAEPVSIHCETNQKELLFRVRNVKAVKQTDAQGGVGLENIKRRLALLYPLKHRLEIEDTPRYFTVNLQIAL
ncbi:MAG: histidine kinase [Chitinophagaceae bacterium]